MIEAFIALGSNLDNPRQQVERAIQTIASFPSSQLIKISPFYETKPMGYADQDIFINAVVLIQTDLNPFELLKYLQEIEKNQQRIRTIKNGPRTIDCDLIMVGKEVINSPELTLPHPGLTSRDFVLKPLLDIVPDATLPDGRMLHSFLETLSLRYI